MRCPTLNELPPPQAGRTGWPWTKECPQLPDAMPNGSPWPRVSVVTPSYNQSPYVEETIRSVLLQGYPDLEYIIIDGGSTDGSTEIIRKYEPWLSYWKSEHDNGQSDAINKGWLGVATGEFLNWLNSDDTFQPGVVVNAVLSLVSKSAPDCVYSSVNVIDETSRVIGYVQARTFALNEFLLADFVPQQTAFIRRDAVKAVNGVDPALHYRMDSDLFLRLSQQCRLEFIGGIGANFRVCQGTKSVQQPIGFRSDRLTMLDHFYARSDLAPEVHAIRDRVYANAYLEGACRGYGAKQIVAAKNDLAAALELDADWRDDPRHIADLLLGWAEYPVLGDPLDYVLAVFYNLPETATSLRAYRHKAIAKGALYLMFKAYGSNNWPLARRSLLAALISNPRLLLDRGVLSVAARSLMRFRISFRPAIW